MELTQRKKRVILSIVLFIITFGGLLTVATFFDLQIDDILTKNALLDGNFTSNHIFGAAFEILGDCPVYLMFSFGFALLFIYAKRNMAKIGKNVVMALSLIFNVVSVFAWAMTIVDYIMPHLIMSTPAFELEEGPYLYVVYVLLGVFGSFLSIMAVNNFSDDSIKKLLKFAVALLVLAAIPTILINLGIKSYVGRIRYRAMNMYPDDPNYGFAAFARWYEVKGQWIPKEKMRELFNTTDALKSFPSGHTSAAGIIYGLIMLIDALEIKKKSSKALLWICPITFTVWLQYQE